MGFSRQGFWSGLLFPSPEDLPDPGIDPVFPALQADTLPSEPPGKPEDPSYSPVLEKQFGVMDSSPQMAWVQMPF